MILITFSPVAVRFIDFYASTPFRPYMEYTIVNSEIERQNEVGYDFWHYTI